MNLANREKIANHLRSEIKDKKTQFKNMLLNMKGGAVYDFWKKNVCNFCYIFYVIFYKSNFSSL